MKKEEIDRIEAMAQHLIEKYQIKNNMPALAIIKANVSESDSVNKDKDYFLVDVEFLCYRGDHCIYFSLHNSLHILDDSKCSWNPAIDDIEVITLIYI